MKENLLEICYLIGSVTFIIGLKMMGNAKTARNGNLIGAVGMTIVVIGAWVWPHEQVRSAVRVTFGASSRHA